MNVLYTILLLTHVCIENRYGHVLDAIPLIDGHNDLANNIYEKLRNNVSAMPFDRDLTDDIRFGKKECPYCYTDIPRLRKGKVGAQFFAAFVPCDAQFKDSVSRSLEQIDVIKRLIHRYPNDLQFASSVSGIWDAFNNSRIGILIGVEGGHAIDSKIGVLRMYYDLGVRYMTLTHSCSTPWADNSWEPKAIKNLTKFGEIIVREMNRLGMLVDLSHVTPPVMIRAMEVSRAPVIFSHSAVKTLCPHNRNVPDHALRKLKQNNGILMIVFHNEFITHNVMKASVADVARHINYVVDIIGINHVGIGADYDGVPFMPKGLEDVSKYPNLFDYLKDHNPTRWTSKNMRKLAALNFMRVLRAAERIRDRLRSEDERENIITIHDLKAMGPQSIKCRS